MGDSYICTLEHWNTGTPEYRYSNAPKQDYSKVLSSMCTDTISPLDTLMSGRVERSDPATFLNPTFHVPVVLVVPAAGGQGGYRVAREL